MLWYGVRLALDASAVFGPVGYSGRLSRRKSRGMELGQGEGQCFSAMKKGAAVDFGRTAAGNQLPLSLSSDAVELERCMRWWLVMASILSPRAEDFQVSLRREGEGKVRIPECCILLGHAAFASWWAVLTFHLQVTFVSPVGFRWQVLFVTPAGSVEYTRDTSGMGRLEGSVTG